MLKKLVVGTVCVVVLAGGIFGGKALNSVQKYRQTMKEIKISHVDLSKISDGKYTGACDAVIVGAEVSVTVKDQKITNIVLVNHKYGKGKPAEVIPEKVLKAQSLQVDTISGATNSSKVILKSIENALKSGQA